MKIKMIQLKKYIKIVVLYSNMTNCNVPNTEARDDKGYSCITDDENGIACCPFSGRTSDNILHCGLDTSHSTDQLGLDVSSGWKKTPVTSNGKTYNGVYGYNDTAGGFLLDVVPNYKNLTWVGTAPSCGINYKDQCSASNWEPTPDGYKPQIWTGYTTNRNLGSGGIQVQPNCNGCTSGGHQILCTTSTSMTNDSCPGFNTSPPMSNPPIPKINDNYFSNISTSDYPRGVGHCFYGTDMVKNDTDLSILQNLYERDKIPKGLYVELGLNYCYKQTKSGACGTDSNNNSIRKCTNFQIDNVNNIGPATPCQKLINDLKDNGQRSTLSTRNTNWCNKDENKNTALCDCINSDRPPEITIRNIFHILTDVTLNSKAAAVLTVPKECWFPPCTKYALPTYNTITPCTSYNLNCNNINIIDRQSKAIYEANAASINCSLNGNPTPTPPASSTNLSTSQIYIVLLVIPIIIIFITLGILLIKQSLSINTNESIKSDQISNTKTNLG
jgi:hypothetical protein